VGRLEDEQSSLQPISAFEICDSGKCLTRYQSGLRTNKEVSIVSTF